RRWRVRIVRIDGRAFRQSVLPRRNNALTGGEAFKHHGLRGTLVADLDVAPLDLIVLADSKRIEPVRAMLDGVIGHYQNIFPRIDQKPRRYRKPGPQRIVLILKSGFHPDRPTCLINLIIDKREMTLTENLCTVRRERNDRDVARGKSLIDLRDI